MLASLAGACALSGLGERRGKIGGARAWAIGRRRRLFVKRLKASQRRQAARRSMAIDVVNGNHDKLTPGNVPRGDAVGDKRRRRPKAPVGGA